MTTSLQAAGVVKVDLDPSLHPHPHTRLPVCLVVAVLAGHVPQQSASKRTCNPKGRLYQQAAFFYIKNILNTG